MLRSLNRPLKLVSAVSGTCAFSLWWALRHPDGHIYTTIESHIPYGHQLLDYFEERRHITSLKERQHYYETSQSVKPYISKSYLHDNDSMASNDPLPPEKFFDAQSGTVGTISRSYLPLVVLPNVNDPLIHDVSMCLNDLISSVNAAAVSDETVRAVAKRCRRLANAISLTDEQTAKAFRHESLVFEGLVDAHKTLREQYGVSNVPSDLTMKYHKRLANEILKVENVLVAHCNSRNASITSKASEPASSESLASSSAPPSRLAYSSSLAPSPSSIFSAPSSSIIQDTDLNMFLPSVSSLSPEILDLQLTFTLLADAIKSGSNIPIDHYIQAIHTTVQASREPDKMKLINQALKGAKIPPDVDMDKIVQQILTTSR